MYFLQPVSTTKKKSSHNDVQVGFEASVRISLFSSIHKLFLYVEQNNTTLFKDLIFYLEQCHGSLNNYIMFTATGKHDFNISSVQSNTEKVSGFIK